ncbi:putative bifunctional diguanylate cyclase/phosphodiesterase [Pseudonocardia kunmingensis]|uniref:Diguanylate cyclase/phosphodiesterase n=1 Tax=Pseudonocardia kunmingensis TaxID=630975 RepID=A0A543D4N0_9PSEU|nr:EAL domain-containing protein [Pseudonocardia kunmingensis]TQM04284.1 diguanylate cyclase/phosphodiesterase [Pseudonocardia kunmingensis]
MTAAPPARTPRPGASAAAGAAAALVVLGGLDLALDGDAQRLAANLGVLLLAAAGGACCLRAARRSRAQARRGWAALTVACWSWAAGQAVWTVHESMAGPGTAYPSAADVGFLVFPAAALVGLARLAPPGAGMATPRRLLDALVFGCAIGLVAWVSVLDTVVARSGTAVHEVAPSLVYPVADAVLLTVAVLTVAQTRDAPLRWGLLGGALLAMTASDAAFAYQIAAGGHTVGTIGEWGWRAAFCLLAIAGALVQRDSSPFTSAAPPPRESGRAALLLPYVPLTAAAVFAALDSLVDAGPDMLEVALVVGLVLLVLARQYVTVRENQELTRAVQEREVQLHHLAFHDPLTGLANRALFLDRLEHALERAERSGQSVSVAFVDLDGFKAVNDTLGHAAGDALLTGVATRLRGALRSSDTLARLGGDEFAVLVEQGDDATVVARRLLAALGTPFHVHGRSVEVSASIGVAGLDADQDTGPGTHAATRAATLLHRADVAMYAVKASGKGDVAAHSADLPAGRRPDPVHPAARRGTLRRGPGLSAAFATALQRHEVHAIYQPVVDPVSGRISALEVLARWTHEGVAVPPSEFMPACAEAGLSGQLTALMLEQGCAQLAAWTAGLAHRRLRIAVNVDPTEFGDEGLPDRVAGVLRRHGLSPGQLALEMTETAVNNRPGSAVDVMRRLRALGVRVALDDFGTGYSTLSRLARTPADTVKIDRSFVAHIDHDEQQRWFLRGILDLARHLGLRTVAEGVERAGQLHELRRQGCDLVQGHFVARPATGARLTPAVLADLPVLPPHLRGIRASDQPLGAGRWFRPASEPG